MRKKWEYKTVNHSSPLTNTGYHTEDMDKEGREGWELCGVSSPATNWGSWYYHYKREVIEKTNQQ